MARKGICAICGKGGKLTEEHIPPRCTGNLREITLHSLEDYLAAEGDPDALPNPQPRPKGTSWATLCERCNSEVLGSWYVPEFCRFVGGVTWALANEYRGRLDEIKGKPGVGVTVTSGPVRALCVVKTIAGMILALNAESDDQFRTTHHALADFVLEKDSPLPPPYRPYMAVHLGNWATFAPTMVRRDPAGELVAFSAVEQPPLAYILTFNEASPDDRPFLPMGGLYDLGHVAYAAVGRITLNMLVGFRDSPVPGEYGQSNPREKDPTPTK